MSLIGKNKSKTNGTYVFGGGSTDYFTTTFDINGISNITVLCEGRLVGTASQDYGFVSSAPATPYMYLTYDNSVNKRFDGALRDSSSNLSNHSAGWTPDANWHQFAFTFDGTIVELYVDGVSIGSVSEAGFTSFSEQNFMQIGKERQLAGSILDGEIRTVQIYDAALTSAQLLALAEDIENTTSDLVCNFYKNKTPTTWTDDVAGKVATNVGGVTLT